MFKLVKRNLTVTAISRSFGTTTAPFKVLGLQQIALGGLSKSGHLSLW